MKFRLILPFVSLFFLSVGQAQNSAEVQVISSTPPSADEILKDAYQQAAKEKKKVFIMFHASWCIWCRRMDSSINDASCRDFFEKNFVIRHMVVSESRNNKALENPGADEFRTKNFGNNLGIPFWLILDKKGNLLANSRFREEGAGFDTGNNIGCPATEKEVAYFIQILKKASKMTPPEEAAITKRFRQNEH